MDTHILRGAWINQLIIWSLLQREPNGDHQESSRREEAITVLAAQIGYTVTGSDITTGSTHLPCSRIKSTSRSTASNSGMLNLIGVLPT